MTTAPNLLAQVEAAGGTIEVHADKLRLKAPRPLPDDLLDDLRARKAEIIALLTPSTDTSSAEDWLVHFEERAGIGEFDGDLSRPDAEARAFECCIIEWMERNPPRSVDPDRCIYCGAALGEPGRDAVPFLSGRGHVWLHQRCHSPWHAARRVEAARALMAMGIHVGQH